MINKIWLQQPLAFARAGTSKKPLAAFDWTVPDLRPRGSGRTTIMPDNAYDVDDNGVLQLRTEEQNDLTLFRDEDGVRPVCPFFELHGEWNEESGPLTPKVQSGPLTPKVLCKNGLSLGNLKWSIRHANLKAYAYTGSHGDRIEAAVPEIRGDNHKRHPLIGSSPPDADNPLIPRDQGIEMGKLQVLRPASEGDKVRIRFYAPPGHAYGPTNLAKLITRTTGVADVIFALLRLNSPWAGFRLPPERCILNPDADWAHYQLIRYGQLAKALPRIFCNLRYAISMLSDRIQQSEFVRFVLGDTDDAGKLPPILFAWRYGGGAVISSVGVVDDLGDGIITCTLDDGRRCLTANARVAVCPPHFAPDRRPPVSIADNLTDRTRRADVRDSNWAEGLNWDKATAELEDLLDRGYETAGLSNLDACNDELAIENRSHALYRKNPRPPENALWSGLDKQTVLDLPLTERGWQEHHRNTVAEVLEQRIRDDPTFTERWIRKPADEQYLYYNRQMPGLMRGPDRHPLHLTRRQFEALLKWVASLRSRRWGPP